MYLYLFLSTLSMTISFLFFQYNHPLMLGLMLFIQTFFIAALLGLFSKSFWFSYILFIVFVGGLLILFMYMISLIFNKKFFIIKNNLLTIFNMIMFNLILGYFIKNFNFEFINNSDLMNFKLFNYLYLENSLNLNKLFNFPNNMINLLMISYLFFMMIIVVKITNFFQGPLRMKFN